MTDQPICPECGGPMIDDGVFVIKDDTGEHLLCCQVHDWSCADVWCDGIVTELVGDPWNETYDEEYPQ